MKYTIRPLIRQARALWPHSKHYRKQWVRSILELRRCGKHILHGAQATWGIPGLPTPQEWWPNRSWT